MRGAAEKRRKLWILLLAVICSSFVVANSSVMPCLLYTSDAADEL